MTSGLAPVRFSPPLVNPSPNGLFAVTQWIESGPDDPIRWLPAGVDFFENYNYPGDDAFGVWEAEWCFSEADLTEQDVITGERAGVPDPYLAVTCWGYDECDMTSESQAEVRTRAQQVLRLREQVAAEREFAARLLVDAGTPDTASDILGAVARIEGLFAVTNTIGQIHASAEWAASAAQAQLIVRSGSVLRTPLGHLWVFGGGYVGGTGLEDTIVGTSPTFGWRNQPVVRDAFKPENNRYFAIAERSVLVGFEALVGAVTVSG